MGAASKRSRLAGDMVAITAVPSKHQDGTAPALAGSDRAWDRAQNFQRSVRSRALPAFKISDGAVDLIEGRVGGQWRAMRDGMDGIPGNGGNVVSVTCRLESP